MANPYQVGQDPYPLYATLTDMSGIDQASLFWSLNQSTWNEVPMSHYQGNDWRGYVPGQANGTTVYYYFWARDSSPQQNESTSSTYSFQVVDGGPPSGPDSYGYYIHDWLDVERVTYSWIDISGTGTPLGLGDDSNANVALPFNFYCYGQNFTSVDICSNGFIQFNDSDYYYWNSPLPEPSMGIMLALFWRDLNPGASGQVYYQSFPSEHIFVISWVNVPYYPDSGSNTFQVILYDQDYYGSQTGDGHMVVQYSSTNDYNGCTIGIQNGSTAVQYVYNASYDYNALPLTNGSALHVTTGGLSVDPVTDLQIAIQDDDVLLDWSAAAGAQSYRVYYSSDPYSGFSQLAETSATGWTHTGGASGGVGFYRVTSIGGFRAEPLRLIHDPASLQPAQVQVLSRREGEK